MLEVIKTINFIIGVTVWALVFYGLTVAVVIPSAKQFWAHFKGRPYHKVELKIYLDDERTAPKGWVQVRTYQECLHILQAFKPSHLSLDHDLGEEKTGYDIVKWIEEETYNNSRYNPPIITIHSANPVGRQNIERGIKSIERILSFR